MILHSQNGWLASADRNVIGIHNYQVPGAHRYFSCASGVAPILINFAGEFHAKIEKIDTGTYDDWGYASPIVIPGSPIISNHGSGTALDINAVFHPWKKIGTFHLLQVIRLHFLIRKYGLRWGGDYGRGCFKDEMHFEIVETALQVRYRIARMKLAMPKVAL